jgi:hypothetical protein
VTIQIDDAGWGSLVGGTVIGAYRTHTKEFTHGIIAPRFFQGNLFAQKAYLDEAARQAEACLAQLDARPKERVEICRGYVLTNVREWLRDQGFALDPTRITGALQDKVEHAFWEHLRDVGFCVERDLYGDPARRGLLWWQQVRWLKGGDADATRPVPERAATCKTGWASYKIWATHPYGEAKRLARQRRGKRRRAR